jgi:hypothetical protein
MNNRLFDTPIEIGKNLVAIAIQDSDLLVQPSRNGTPVLLQSFLAHTHGAEGWDLEEPTILNLLGTPVVIVNKDRFPNARWIEMPKRIGDVGDQGLYFLGKDEDAQNLVGKIDPEETTLFAIPLNELLAHSTEKISIPEPLPDV